jgi:hypothetical protein
MDVSACSTKHLKEIPPLSRFAKGGIKEALMRDSIRLARIFINLFRVENALGDRLPIAVGVLAKETTPITFMACGAAYLVHLQQDRIVVAVDEHIFYFLKMAGFLAFEPRSVA